MPSRIRSISSFTVRTLMLAGVALIALPLRAQQPEVPTATPPQPAAGAEGQRKITSQEELDAAIKEAEEALKNKEYPKAYEIYTAVAQANPTAGMVGRARVLTAMRDFDAAIQEYQQAENAIGYVDTPLLHISRGQTYLEAGAASPALNDFQAAAKATGLGNFEVQFGLAKAYVLLNQFPQAIKPLTRVIEAQPENAEAYQLRGRANWGVFKYKDAVADLQKAISLNPDDHESYFWLGVVDLRLEDYQGAVDQLGKAIEHYKPKPEQEGEPYSQAYSLRSSAFIELGKKLSDEAAKTAAYEAARDDAQKLLDQTDEKNTNHAGIRANALYGRGIAERMLGQLGKAIRTFTEAIQVNPELAEAYFRRGICYHLTGEDKLAIADFVEAANLSQEPDPRANLWEGFTHAKLGKYDDAIRAYGNAIAASDRYTPAYFNRGLAYLALGEDKKAIDDFDDAIRLDPINPDYYMNRGYAYERLRDYELASQSFASVIQLDKNNADAYRHMADCLQRLGRNELVNEYRQKAQELAQPATE